MGSRESSCEVGQSEGALVQLGNGVSREYERGVSGGEGEGRNKGEKRGRGEGVH